MEMKKLMVSFVMIASVLFLMSTAAAHIVEGNTSSDYYTVYVDGNSVSDGETIGVIEGETLNLKIVFTTEDDDPSAVWNNVKIKAEIEGTEVDVSKTTSEFDVEAGTRYSKTLSITMPTDLDDELSDDATLEIKIYNKDDKSELDTISLKVQKESYNAEVMSISTTQSAEPGELFPVDVVLKNKGYNDLEDLYVTVRIAELGVERTAYFGDLVADENAIGTDDDDTDTVSGRIYINVPNNAKAGTYTLEVEVENEDTTEVRTREIVVNALEDSLIKSGNSLIIVNPTNNVKVYRVVSDSTENFVVVSAGSSESVKTTSGEYNVFDGNELIGTVVFGDDTSSEDANPVAVLTIVLAIVFIVLLIVLFVLIGKKPSTEEFGESYY